MKRLLVVVDYQIDFVNGSLGFESAKDLEVKLIDRIELAKSRNEDIIFTKDIHESNYLSTEEGKHSISFDFAISINKVTALDDLSVGDIPEWDSLHHMMIITGLQKEFGVEFQREELIDNENVADLVALVEERTKK